VKKRNLDDIRVWHGTEQVCLTDLPWPEAAVYISNLLMRSADPIHTYMGMVEHFHTRLREVGDKYDIFEER